MPSIEPTRRNGIEIYYEDSGAGDPLVLIGGLTSSHLVWGLVVPELALHYRVITPDNRGSGRTVVHTDDGERTTECFASDLLALLDELQLERIHLMGVSMGGMIVQEFALRHPDRVASLIIGCSTAGGTHVISPPQEIIQTLFQGAAEGAAEDSAKAAIEILVHPDSLTQRSERVKFYEETKVAYPHSSEELLRRATGVAKHDTFDRLSGLAVPSLVVTGSHDQLVPKENSALIAGQIPDAELVEIGEAGHLFFAEQPEETSRVVLEFLSRHRMD